MYTSIQIERDITSYICKWEKQAEDELDSLLTQLDLIREKLKEIKAQCFNFKNIQQNEMDQM